MNKVDRWGGSHMNVIMGDPVDSDKKKINNFLTFHTNSTYHSIMRNLRGNQNMTIPFSP